MSNDNEFVSGLGFKAPHDNAPEYVKGKGWIRNAELIAYLQARIAKGEESTNFDVKVSQGGKWYAAVDNWKPQQGNTPSRPAPQRERAAPADADPFRDDDLPF